MSQAKETLEAAAESGLNVAELLQYKLPLEEKLSTLTRLDGEILDLVAEEEVEDEIEQADVFKERIRLVMINIDDAVGTRIPVSTGGHPIPTSPTTSTEPTGSPLAIPPLSHTPQELNCQNWL